MNTNRECHANETLVRLVLQEISEAAFKINLDVFGGIEIVFELATVNKLLTDVAGKFDMANFLDSSEKSHDTFLQVVKDFVRANVPGPEDGNLEKTLCAIIYLLIAIESSEESNGQLKSGLSLNFKSEITIGSGLGSSASFAVCLAATFYTYSLARTTSSFVIDFNTSTSSDEKSFFLNAVSSWAFLSERIMHGNPSGLDNAICTFGNVVQFTKKPQVITNLASKMKLNILLVNSGVSRNTLQVVEKVKKLRGEHEQLIDLVLKAMGVLVYDVVKVSCEGGFSFNAFEERNSLYSYSQSFYRFWRMISQIQMPKIMSSWSDCSQSITIYCVHSMCRIRRWKRYSRSANATASDANWLGLVPVAMQSFYCHQITRNSRITSVCARNWRRRNSNGMSRQLAAMGCKFHKTIDSIPPILILYLHSYCSKWVVDIY